MTNRRDFLKKSGLLSLGLSSLPLISNASIKATKEYPNKTAFIEPSELQQTWMDLKFGMFIHFGINTYYDLEWSDGSLDPIKYNPTELDTDQWCRVAKEAGMKYIVFVTKHIDGFCNWPTKFTNYSVTSSPFKRDILKEVVDSARKNGLKVGLYYALWDRHEPTHQNNEPAYADFVINQITELLTNYGEIIEIWFDGFWKKQQSGWSKKIDDNTGEKIDKVQASKERDENFIQSWRMEGTYRWQMDRIYQHIKMLQPNCLVMNNSTTAYPGVPLHPVDIRSGEKYTSVKEDRKIWNWKGKDIYLPLQIETTMSVKGNQQFPSGNWFWHESDHSVASKEQILQWLEIANTMESNLLLNVGPMANGKLRPEDETILKSLGV